MKLFFILFASVFLSAAALFSAATTASFGSPVTASQYCRFLNHVAVTDTDHLFDEKMEADPAVGCILRLGMPGKYSYQVVAGRENFPICYVNFCDVENYAAKESYSLIDNGKNDNDLLKSNQRSFLVDDSMTETQLLLTDENGGYSSNGSFFQKHPIIGGLGFGLYSLFVAREIWKASPSFEEMKIVFRSPNAAISDEEAMLLFNNAKPETQRAILAARGYSETQIESFFENQLRDPSGREPDSTTWFSNIRLWGLGGNAQERLPLMPSRNVRESARSSIGGNQQLISEGSLNESQSLHQQQEALLHSLEQSTSRLRDRARGIQDEVREQNDILDRFRTDLDMANETVRDVSARLTSPEIKNRNNCFKNARIKAVILSELAVLYYVIKEGWFEN